jgi:hypothetical protein
MSVYILNLLFEPASQSGDLAHFFLNQKRRGGRLDLPPLLKNERELRDYRRDFPLELRLVLTDCVARTLAAVLLDLRRGQFERCLSGSFIQFSPKTEPQSGQTCTAASRPQPQALMCPILPLALLYIVNGIDPPP